MDLYCFKCKQKTGTSELTENVTKNNRNQAKGKCDICGAKKCQFLKNNENLDSIYFDPKTGYSGINDIQRKSGKSQKEVVQYLNQQNTYNLHKPARRNFKTEKVYVHEVDEQWQSDLVEMIPYSRQNKNFKYLLTVIDCFSKFAWAIPIKNKTGNETTRAFQLLFKQKKPKKIQTDKGKEYYNSRLNKLFKDENVHHFSTESEKKASICERFNRTIKEKMWKIFTQNQNHKWVDIIDDLLANYNNSIHRSIKMSPIDAIKPENRALVFQNLYPETKEKSKISTKFQIGDKIRITKYKTIFSKGYLPNWTSEQFVIKKVCDTVPTTYEIEDLNGEKILGKFYAEEITLFDPKILLYK